MYTRIANLLDLYDFRGIYDYSLSLIESFGERSINERLLERMKMIFYPFWADSFESLIFEIETIDLRFIPDTTNLTIALESFRAEFESDQNSFGSKIEQLISNVEKQITAIFEILNIEISPIPEFIRLSKDWTVRSRLFFINLLSYFYY